MKQAKLHEYQKYLWNVIILQGKAKTKPKVTIVLFVARLLIFAVIGHNTMRLPEICQVLTVMLSLTEVLSSDIQKNIIPR